DGAAISLALSRLASPDTLSEQLTAQLDTLNQQQGRIDAMKQALATLASGIAHTHAENGVLGDQLSSATQRLNRLYQEASLEAARQSELAQEIASLQTDIRDKEQSLVSEYEAALTQARSAVQLAQTALGEQPEDAVLKDALAQARAEEEAAQTRWSALKAQIAAHPFTAVADTNLADFEVSMSQVGAQNPTLHAGQAASDTQLEDVDALSTRAEQGIAEAEGKQGLAEQNVVANRAMVEALRKELETLSAGMQAQFEALNEQRVAYDALQIALAEGQSLVEARQTALKTAT
ncbi:hypothetical protein, partial [Vibrio coralliilyticus]|uniref:hypothetical protein n=1 Tax=Vibrio coralliilyticus TaxID=190893 RepID=UPI000365EF8D